MVAADSGFCSPHRAIGMSVQQCVTCVDNRSKGEDDFCTVRDFRNLIYFYLILERAG